MKKNLPSLAALFASALVFGGTPDLTVSGDGTADGRDASGNAVAAKAEQLEFVPGLRGQAIRFKPTPEPSRCGSAPTGTAGKRPA